MVVILLTGRMMSLPVSDPMEGGGEWSIPWSVPWGVVCPMVHPRGDVVHPLVHPLGVICPPVCLGDVADPPGRKPPKTVTPWTLTPWTKTPTPSGQRAPGKNRGLNRKCHHTHTPPPRTWGKTTYSVNT